MVKIYPAGHLSWHTKNQTKTENMIMRKERVGVIGATSIVGECLLPLLIEERFDIVAFSRQASLIQQKPINRGVVWRLLPVKYSSDTEPITKWICLSPITALPKYFSMLLLSGAKHVVTVASTSSFSKKDSSDQFERNLAIKIAESEKQLIDWAENNQITWTILRPTLIYGLGRDTNVSVIARFIRRFSFFPLLGEAQGLRQPIHAKDVAYCCRAALKIKRAFNHSYNISGGEILTYREMVERIFNTMGRKPHFLTVPLPIFRIAFFCLRLLPLFRHWSPAMAERMNIDLVFDNQNAKRNLKFAPRNFVPTREDILGER
jgi:NAD dependent epimerase/dehydratase family